MSELPVVESAAAVAAGESRVSRAIPFSLIWLHAVYPRIFTPRTWIEGRMTRIQLRSPDAKIDVNVYRVISHFKDGNIGLQDEIHAHHENTGTQFNFEFGPEPDHALIDFNRNVSMPERMQSVIHDLSRLVCIKGASAEATNMDSGSEAMFESDGFQWIDMNSGQVIAPIPEIVGLQSTT